MKLLQHIVPRQKKGVKTEALAHIRCTTRQGAKDAFESASSRLFNINEWGRLSGMPGASFTLMNAQGHMVAGRAPMRRDLIRITLPAPGNKSGEGYDWVSIEDINCLENPDEDSVSVAIRVRPAENPDNSAQGPTAHFYTKDATSTFTVIRKGLSVWAMEFGRNELPNTDVSLLNSIRNLVLAIAAKLGIARYQWKGLMNGILKGDSVVKE